MKNGLNFNYCLFTLFLSFVSFWANAEVPNSTSSQGSVEHLKQEIRKGPENVQLVTPLAEKLYKKGQYEKVTALLWKHIETVDRDGILLLAQAHEKRKEGGDMARAANILVGKNAKDFEAQTLLGEALTLQKKPKEAMEAFKLAIEANPKFEPAYHGVIKIYQERTPPNLYELRILYQDLIENIGPRAIYYTKLCEINTQDGTFENAMDNCKLGIQKDPSVASNFVYLALNLKQTGDEDGYKEQIRKAAVKFPMSEHAQFEYAQFLASQKNYLEAMKYYKVATEADANSARSWLGLANSSFELRKYEVSLIAYRNACKFDRKNAVAFRRSATVLRNANNSEWSGKFGSASENCTF